MEWWKAAQWLALWMIRCVEAQTSSDFLEERFVSFGGGDGGGGDAEIAFNESLLHFRLEGTVTQLFPFSAVGSFDNGCTGSLVGPCHVLTAGHCILDPRNFRLSDSIKFRVIPDQAGTFLHVFKSDEIRVAQRWETLSDASHDVALVRLLDPDQIIPLNLGYFSIGTSSIHDQSVVLNIAGYPSLGDNLELWYDVCRDVVFDYGERRFVDHSCEVQRGSSGSPMWFYSQDYKFREMRALHTSALQFTSLNETQSMPLPQAIILSDDILEEIRSWINELPCL